MASNLSNPGQLVTVMTIVFSATHPSLNPLWVCRGEEEPFSLLSFASPLGGPRASLSVASAQQAGWGHHDASQWYWLCGHQPLVSSWGWFCGVLFFFVEAKLF